jgi:transposase-like protein
MRSELDRLIREMQEFAYWKERRDLLIQEALTAGMPVERIAAEMGIARSVIRRVKVKVGA